MFKDKVETIPLDKEHTGLIFEALPGETLIQDAIVGDYGEKVMVTEKSFNYYPDYAIRGIYQKIDKGHQHIFTPDPNDGIHLLLITGIPKTHLEKWEKWDKEQEKSDLYNSPTVFKSYWEDSRLGYIFEIVYFNLTVHTL